MRRDAGGIPPLLVLLGIGLAFRLLIVALLPGSGFGVDINSFAFWASNLASDGLSGFYQRPFFHDYTPGYLYVLWLVGEVGKLFAGGPGDLIKVPPILCDIALAYLAWSMTREFGGSERAARIGAFLVIVNPVTWVDSALWGQVDSVGVVFLLFALRELWRDRPERSAILAMLAALIKPQLGILIPIVAVVTIRRALRPDGGYGNDDPEAVLASGGFGWERRIKGPVRILTTGLAGLATAFLVSLPFGLSLPGLIAQVFSAAAGYPYLSVNAYNPWALVSQDGHGIATDRAWICDSTVVPSGPTEFRIGPFTIPEWGTAGSTQSCPDGFMIGPIPAVLVGAALFVVALAVVLWLVARRPDRRTMLVGLAVLALAFFVLPTRVHERYLFPLVAIGAILAAVALRWRLAYIVSSVAVLANMYAVLTTLYPGCIDAPGAANCNPNISDWLHVGDVVTSYGGIAAAAIAQVAVLGFAFLQLRSDSLEDLQLDIEGEAEADDDDEGPQGAEGWRPAGGRGLRVPRLGDRLLASATSGDARAAPGEAAMGATIGAGITDVATGGSAAAPAGPGASAALMPIWEDRDASGVGPWGWVKARFRDRPVRADLSGALTREGGGRLDKTDLWMVLVLIATLATVRVWRLAEPYDMHFDEVYHPRTAMEFLQLWRYGMSHDIYEWTHPHLAKFAMAVGIIAFGDDRVTATANLDMANLAGAAVEPRWDDGGVHARSGDRLWVAGTDEVRAYDLATRALVASWPVPGVSAIGVDTSGHRVFIGTASGSILTLDTLGLDSLRATNTPVMAASATSDANGNAAPASDATVAPVAWSSVGGAVQLIHATSDGAEVEVVAGDAAASKLFSLDASTTKVNGQLAVSAVTAIVDHDTNTVAVADSKGIDFVETTSGTRLGGITVISSGDPGPTQLEGPVGGLTATTGLADNPLYLSYMSSAGPMMASVTASDSGSFAAQVTARFALPGHAAGAVNYDSASRMVHTLGQTSDGHPTVYVINPNGSGPPANTVYADAQLPFDAAAIVMDDGQQYPSTDRQQLLAFSADGQMATVPIGRHAWAWRLPGVAAGVLMGALIYILTRLLFKRREIAVAAAILVAADGLLFVQSRIGMNDTYVGLGIVAAYTIFAWLWLRPGGTRRHWIAWAIGMPVLGVTLGLALASKWVAAYAIGGLGILVLARSALGRLILILGMIGASAFLGYIAIEVPEGAAGGNYMFLAIMVALTLLSVVVTILHPIAWTFEEERLAIWGPPVIGVLVVLAAFALGIQDTPYGTGSLQATPIELGFAAIVFGGVMYAAFVAAGRFGLGPMAIPPEVDDPAAHLDPPAPAPKGWLNLGSGFGIPAFFTLLCLVVLPVVVYVISYIPWAFVGQDQLVPGWPPGHTGQTLVDLTGQMYAYHNNLTTPHPATSPWWAWPLDLKPVWFYQDSFAGGTTASIYDAGNLVSWWLAIPAMGFAAYQAFKRHSVGLGLITVAFATQWLAWARIDRAAFQYHYYTAVPFLLIASAYLIAELWNGPSWRTWVLVRLGGAAAVLGPFALWLFHRPLCAIAGVTAINPGSQACPTTIPDVSLSPRSIGIAIVVGIGVLLLLRLIMSGGGGDQLRRRLTRAVAIPVSVVLGVTLISWFVPPDAALHLVAVPVEPIALIVTIALLPVAAFVATARDARRFAVGMLVAIVLWFVIWYPNISALPLPAGLTNVYQGLLPSYLYPFQFWVNTTPRAGGPLQLNWIAGLVVLIGALSAAVFYSTWNWRIALAERRAEAAAGAGPAEGSAS